MGKRRRLSTPDRAVAGAVAVVGGLAVLAALGCKGEQRAEPGDHARAPGASAKAVDRARPGELAEGTEDALGLPIPRGMEVRARFPDAVFAAGTMSLADVASYVRDRVDPERVETGPAKTVLFGARLRSGGPKVLRIEVVARGGEVSLVVRDETRPPMKEGLTEAERWRELGLTKEGAPLDPSTLE